MRRISLLFLFILSVCSCFADEVTYDFSSGIPAGWTASTAPFGYEGGDTGRGMQFTSSSTLTLAGVTDVTKVVVTCSSNIADQNTIEVKVGGSSWGKETFAKESNVEKSFSGNAASGSIELVLTRASKSIYIKTVVVTGKVTDNGGGGGDVDENQLDPNYTYSEPTRVQTPGDSFSNQAYSFINNNIEVKASVGAVTQDYFGCNAGNTLTFTATKPIKAIVIGGYVKKDFEATVDNGDIGYVDASDDAVEADPVVVIKDIDSKTVTISCDKQLRCYYADFYFEENPDIELGTGGGEEGDYTYDWEPQTPTTLNISFDEVQYADYTQYMGYPYTDIYFLSEDYEMELGVFASAVSGTVLEEGTYEINDSYETGTVQASPGGDEYYDYPAFIATGFEIDETDGASYYTMAYYLVSGTLTVAAAPGGVKLTLDAKTYYGSTVNATFTGAAVNAGEDTDGIAAVSAPTGTEGKFLDGRRIVIKHAGHTYSLKGVRM